jgi:hypothetical protein
MAALEAEVGGLVAQVAAAQAQKAAYDMQLDSGKKQKALLADKMADLQLASAAGEAELGRLRADLSVLVRSGQGRGGPGGQEIRVKGCWLQEHAGLHALCGQYAVLSR